MPQDNPEYLARKNQFRNMLTVFGRKPVLEVLQDDSLEVFRLHLSKSNKPAAILNDMLRLAAKRRVEICYHDKQALSRISKNGKQDQGVAADVRMKGSCSVDEFIASAPAEFRLIALDRVTNPQNLGMIIRAVCASPATGIVLPDTGCARLDALVIKASAGTLFRASLLRCRSLDEGLRQLRDAGSEIIGLDLQGRQTLADTQAFQRKVFVLGNETDGLSPATQALCNQRVALPMANGVESLNVAVTAGLIAFHGSL